MPEEYVNYTITLVDGVLWAKIDGMYLLFYSGNDGVSAENPVEFKVDEISEFGKPLPGDLVVSFKEANAQEPLSIAWAVIWVIVGIVFAGLAYHGFRKRRNMKRANASS